jgi:hypothetical protein
MIKRFFVRAIVIAFIAAILGGGYAIVLNNDTSSGTQSEIPSGFAH